MGVKLDNQIQVGHNVRIGDRTAIAACTGIAGSSTIGSDCAIGGGTCISGHLEITDHVVLTGMSYVSFSIKEAGTYSSSLPTQAVKSWWKNISRLRSLDDVVRRFLKIERALEAKPSKKATTRENHAPIAVGDTVMDINEILNYLPHRYPFLLIDRVTSLENW